MMQRNRETLHKSRCLPATYSIATDKLAARCITNYINANLARNDEIPVGYYTRGIRGRPIRVIGMIDFSQLGELLRWSLNNEYIYIPCCLSIWP